MIAATSPDPVQEFLTPLGLTFPISVADVRQAYLEKAKTAHPDVGGDVAAFKQLHRTYERALAYARRHGLGWISSAVNRDADQQRVIDHVKILGGRVVVEQIKWVEREVGEDFGLLFNMLVGIELHGPQINDDVLDCLAREHNVLASLRWLDLSGSRITYRGLKLLGWFPQLQWVRLHRTRITWYERMKLRRLFSRVQFVTT